MSQVEQVEAAIGKNCPLAAPLSMLHYFGKASALIYFMSSIVQQIAHLIMFINSSGVLLAQPNWRTTRAAAAFAI